MSAIDIIKHHPWACSSCAAPQCDHRTQRQLSRGKKYRRSKNEYVKQKNEIQSTYPICLWISGRRSHPKNMVTGRCTWAMYNHAALPAMPNGTNVKWQRRSQRMCYWCARTSFLLPSVCALNAKSSTDKAAVFILEACPKDSPDWMNVRGKRIRWEKCISHCLKCIRTARVHDLITMIIGAIAVLFLTTMGNGERPLKRSTQEAVGGF